MILDLEVPAVIKNFGAAMEQQQQQRRRRRQQQQQQAPGGSGWLSPGGRESASGILLPLAEAALLPELRRLAGVSNEKALAGAEGSASPTSLASQSISSVVVSARLCARPGCTNSGA
jgi:hypothetical protein